MYSPVPAKDLSTSARIRFAAIECFGQHGFEVSLRVIADKAGVTPPLVLHHFGSKARLRESCDEQVGAALAEYIDNRINEDPSQTFTTRLAQVGDHAWLIGYLVRSMQAGGPLATSTFERLVADTERYLETGVGLGLIKPSREPAARARWATSSALGSLLLYITLEHPGTEIDFADVLIGWSSQYMFPAIEMYTEGVYADSSLLDAYLHADPTDTSTQES